MKRFFPVITCVFLILSCSQPATEYHPNKLDTTQALYRVRYPNGVWSPPTLDSVIIQTVSKWEFKDSVHSSGGHWVTDTVHYGRIADDTARDAAKKPLFDSLHHPLPHYIFYPIPRGYYQKVTIPIH